MNDRARLARRAWRTLSTRSVYSKDAMTIIAILDVARRRRG